jgi:DNA-binding MarR family transcriptional regulator
VTDLDRAPDDLADAPTRAVLIYYLLDRLDGEATTEELVALSCRARSTVSRAVSELVARDLVSIEQHPTDPSRHRYRLQDCNGGAAFSARERE